MTENLVERAATDRMVEQEIDWGLEESRQAEAHRLHYEHYKWCRWCVRRANA